jgi:iron complex outermembrane receptor protein
MESGQFTLRGGINNVGNKQPLIVSGVPGSTDSSSYDVIGRSFFLAVTAKI